jgi:hypothetical protein
MKNDRTLASLLGTVVAIAACSSAPSTSPLAQVPAGPPPDVQCSGKADFTPCHVAGAALKNDNICVQQTCVQPGCGEASCNAPNAHFPLAPTRQFKCYDDSVEIPCPPLPCRASTPFCGQDAQYGWDAKNPEANRFERDTSVAGQPVVVDEVTGLMWQGCIQGVSGDQCEQGWSGAVTTDWQTALAHCDASTWGGYHDWHMADEFEFMSHVSYGDPSQGAYIDAVAFPSAPADFHFTSSTRFRDDHVVFGMNLSEGYMNAETGKIAQMYSWCVRGGPALARSFDVATDSGDRIVSDTASGLEWQGCVKGLSGQNCEQGAADNQSSWSGALAYCNGLNLGGHAGWRLPNIMELRSLAKNSVEDPAIDTAAFPATPGGANRFAFTWSSTTKADLPTNAFGVDFGYAYVYFYEKTSPSYVRCVRDSKQ